MLRRLHLELIAKHSVRHSLRGGAGLIAIMGTLIIGLVLANVVISPLEAIDQRVAERMGDLDPEAAREAAMQLSREVLRIATRAMGWVMDASDDQLSYLTNDKPALVSAVLVLLMLVTPLFATLGAFNQTSGDIASRGLRYLLIRTERQNIFLGRFVATAVFTAVVFAILFAILGLYIVVKIKVHPRGDMMLWLLGGYLRMTIFAMPYVALCAWISSSIDSPFGSLVLALVAAYVWPLFVMVGTSSSSYVGYLNYLTPWGYKWWLFSGDTLTFVGGIAMMLVFTGGLVWLGLYRFARRDL